MRRFLIVIAITQALVLCWLINSRLVTFSTSLAEFSMRDYHAIRVTQAVRFESSDVLVSNLTPGFVEGYIVGKHGKQVSISTTYRNSTGWTLCADIDGHEITATSHSLQSACLEVLDVFHKNDTSN